MHVTVRYDKCLTISEMLVFLVFVFWISAEMKIENVLIRTEKMVSIESV